MCSVPDQSSSSCEFSDKVCPRFHGRFNYAVYREAAILWVELTLLPAIKHATAIIDLFQGEAKRAAKTLEREANCKDRGVDLILERLDKAYAADKSNQLD